METKITEQSKKRLVIEFKGIDQGFCNLIAKELWNDDHIKSAGFNVAHPLVADPRFVIETDGEESPKSALMGAVKRIKKVNEDVLADIKKEIK